ncbi:MAG: hypothetical protein ACOCZE_09260, partial [Planctomycetota bacterium]
MPKRMKLSTRIALGYVLVGLLVIVCGGVGVYGIHAFGSMLDYVTGPVWATISGAKSTSVMVKSQILAVREISAGIDIQANQRTLEKSRDLFRQALGDMEDGGMIQGERLDYVRKALTRFEANLDAMLAAQQQFQQIKQQFHDNADRLMATGKMLESVCDRAMRQQLAAAGQESTRAAWDVADGTMEANSALLAQLYWVYQLDGQNDHETVVATIQRELAHHSTSLERASAMKLPAEDASDSEFRQRSLIQRYSQLFEDHKKLLASYLKQHKQLDTVGQKYERAASAFVELLDGIAESGVRTARRMGRSRRLPS